MSHMMSVVTFVLTRDDAHRLDEVLVFLKAICASIDNVNRDSGVIEATLESNVVAGLEKHHLFSYVRSTFQYWKS